MSGNLLSVEKLKLGILVSGRGSNMRAILDAIREGRLDAEALLVVSNKAQAPALAIAREAGVPVKALRQKDYEDRRGFDAAVVAELRRAGVQWVVMAGFMRLITPVLLEAFADRIVNIHPSLLPAFPGLNAVDQAFQYGVKVAGCTVHLVNEATDGGPVIAQRALAVQQDDDAGSLAARVLVQEHELYVDVLQAIAEGRVELCAPASDGGRRTVRVRPR